MNITRREFTAGTGTLALALGAGLIGFPTAAFAQNPSMQELSIPGPLPEMSIGDANAPVTIIEYASMTCPHCARFHEITYPELKKRYIDTGKVRFIFREFPLDDLAAAGFMLARCAVKDAPTSDKYFDMVDLLFSTQEKWAVNPPLPPLFNTVKQTGFTQETFDACLANRQLFAEVKQTRDRGSQKLGVGSTPTFFINGKKLAGALTIDQIEKEMQPYLKS